MKHPRYSQGQTIVEAIVVVSVVVILMTGLVAATTASLKSAQSSRIRGVATSQAEDGLEYVRSLRDESWDTFQSYSGEYCLNNEKVLTAGNATTCPNNISTTVGNFTRTILFSWDGSKMTVTSKVDFLAGAASTNVTLVTYFTNWR